MQTPIPFCLAVIALLAAQAGHAASSVFHCFPTNKATGVNPDTHLVLTFPSNIAVGTSGAIRVYDAADHSLVDTLDLSIPPGPDPTHRVALPASAIDPTPATPTTTTPAVRTTPPDLHNYQLTTIGGLGDFHFYPILVHGNVATIFLHNNVLHYHHSYIVRMDPQVLIPSSGSFSGFITDRSWTFRTKAAPPSTRSTRLVVSADGSGDFNTVQGAVDFVPDHPAKRITLFIRNGRYEEIVFFQHKSNLTFRGEDRDKVQVTYGNNSAFNPPMPGPSRRCAFSVYDSTGIELENFSIANSLPGQAEGLLIYGSKNIVRQMNITGSGDALNLRGPVYLMDSRIVGDGDTILGVGPAFFQHCEIQSQGAYMWIRNPGKNHGNVFVDCTFLTRDRPANAPARPGSEAVLARLPNNHGLNYPYAEAVLIRCRLSGIPAIGWGPVDGDIEHLHFWEFASTDLQGHTLNTSGRHQASRQLKLPEDAQRIADYSDPAFVLDGWKPIPDVP